MNIELEGQIAERDYVIAQWLDIKPRPFFLAAGVLILLLAVVVLWQAFFGPPKFHAGSGKWFVLALLAYMAISFGVWPYKAKRTYRQYKAIHATQRYVVTDEALKVESDRGHGVVPWSDLVKWKFGNGLFLLYPNDTIFYIVPVRLFSSAVQVEQFKELLRRAVNA
ncbi:YcxB family protein [Solimonas sp. K1W22B-7]|uniref:YcxB family protein n=1 Tax=Solimonas sp. K1W22B-7 TaxID=2303331 RepID=UPI0013C422CD|nr:YcxB family protein [Solimonas sp. K1W22B-7]